jgi:hypothetical protein
MLAAKQATSSSRSVFLLAGALTPLLSKISAVTTLTCPPREMMLCVAGFPSPMIPVEANAVEVDHDTNFVNFYSRKAGFVAVDSARGTHANFGQPCEYDFVRR